MSSNKDAVVKKYKYFLFQKKIPPKTVFTTLQDTENLGNIRKVTKEITKRLKYYEKYIFGRPLPKSYDELGSNNPLDYVNSVEKQLTWVAMTFEYFTTEINNFIKLRDQFDRCLLLGEYVTAEKILNRIDNEICVSLWSIEHRLILAEYEQGLEKNKEILNKINNQSSWYITFVSDFLSRRTEKNVSVSRYNETLNRALKNNYNDPRVLEYFNFKLNFSNFGVFTEYSAILYPEYSLSIIDRYITFIQLSQIIACSGNKVLNLIVNNLVNNLLKKINDNSLERLFTLYNSKIIAENESSFSKEIHLIIDSYSCGDYPTTFKLSLEALELYPNCLELYELVIKSSVRINHNHDIEVVIGKKDCLANDILINMQNIYLKNDKTLESINALKKINTILGINGFNNQIQCYLLQNLNINQEGFNTLIFRELNSKFINPRFIQAYNNNEDTDKYLQELMSFNNQCITVKMYYEINKKLQDPSYELDINSISDIRVKRYNSQILIAQGQYQKAAEMNEELLELNDDIKGHVYEDVILNLYRCYIELNELEKALNLVVENYISNNYLVIRMDVLRLINKIRIADKDLLSGNIRLVILYHLYYSRSEQKENGKIYSSYANFLKKNGLYKPHELEEFTDKFKQSDLNYFFRNICIPEIMDSSPYFDDVEEIEEERVKILYLLGKLDPKSLEKDSQEISQISKKRAIRKRIQEIDDSKIIIDLNAIKNQVNVSFVESYQRYKDISRFSKEDTYRVIDVLENALGRTFEIFMLDSDSKGIMRTKDQHFLAYKELFLELRDYFISSNEYGLDSCISIKLRHGTVLNQLRRSFKAVNLITEKDKVTGYYLNNDYWRNHFDTNIIDEVIEVLKLFSAEIDEIIMQASSDWLKFNIDDNASIGLFNYSYSDSEIYQSMRKNKDAASHLELMNMILNELICRTELNLSSLRSKMSGDLKILFFDKLNNIEISINTLTRSTNSSIDFFNRSVAQCRTDLQIQINKVVKWFHISENKFVTDYTFEELFNTCLAIFNTIYPSNKLSAKLNNNSRSTFKGITFASFVDIIINLFANCFMYSKNLETDIDISEDDNYLLLHFKNIVAEKYNDDYHSKRFQVIRSNLINDKNILDQIRKEGGSGFYKILKILRFDLSIVNSFINIDIENGVFNADIRIDKERITSDDKSTHN